MALVVARLRLLLIDLVTRPPSGKKTLVYPWSLIHCLVIVSFSNDLHASYNLFPEAEEVLLAH